MSNKKTFEKITDSQARKASIEALSDRPNKTSHFGEGGLSAQRLKQRFDELPELSRKKINEIIAAFNTVEGAKYIGINAAKQDNLYDFLALFKAAERNGKNIADYIEMLYEPIVGGKATSTSIKDIINEVCSVLISDKTVLDEINVRSNENKNSIEALSDTVNEVNSRVDEGFSKQEKRIIGIERYLGGDNFIVDDSTAYEKTVPKNACEKAKVLSIGGMTYKKKTDDGNLMPYPYVGTGGLDYTVDNGAVTITGINNDSADFIISNGDGTVYPAGTYIFEVGEQSTDKVLSLSWKFSNYATVPSVTKRTNYKYLIASEGSFSITQFVAQIAGEATEVTLYPMFYKSDTPITWQPRGYWLSHTKVTALRSKGANEFTDSARIYSNYQYISAYMVFTFDGLIPNSPYTISLVNGYKGNAESRAEKYVNLSNKSFEPINSGPLGWLVHPNETYCNDLQTVTSSADGKLYLRLYGYNNQAQLNELFAFCTNIMLNCGESALPYTPYVGTIDTFNIPEVVQALDGWGEGVSEDDYNYIERTEGGRWLLHKRSGCVDMGSLDWFRGSITNDGVSYTMHCIVPGMKSSSAVILPKFNQRFDCLYWEDLNGGEMMTAWDSIIVLAVKGYGSGTDFKAAMSGVMLYYALAEPIVTDITDLMPKENLIKVLGGGRIVAENEHSDPVPFSIKYLVTYPKEA